MSGLRTHRGCVACCRLHQEQPTSCLQRAAVYGVVPDPEPALCVVAARFVVTNRPTDATRLGTRSLWDAQERERARDLAIQQLSYPDAPSAGAFGQRVLRSLPMTPPHIGRRFRASVHPSQPAGHAAS